MSDTVRLQRLLLYHIWACVPFALVWLVWPRTVGVSRLPEEILALRLIIAAAGLYVAARSWLVFRVPASARFQYVWPVLDVAFISAALSCKRFPADSWLVLLYLFPVIEAAATLSHRWAMSVAVLAVAGYLVSSGAKGLESLHYAYGAFRLFFLALTASLLTRLGRELARAQRELALAAYRNELAAEMHDGIQQYLSAIGAGLEHARTLISGSPTEAARLAVEQRHAARQAADELRVLVRRLRSTAGTGETVADSLRHYATILQDRYPLELEIRVWGDPVHLSPRVEHALFRIAQEALNNVIKHAQAERALITLEFRPEEVFCTIRDDGVGFDPAALPAGCEPLTGLGMETMRQRAADMGGTFRVESEQGGGTAVTFTVPHRGVQE